MGQEISAFLSPLYTTLPPRDRDRDVVFVVPHSLHLTTRQMSEMIACGQQPGVPFSLSGEGARRPQGKKARVHFAENSVTLHRTSVKVMDEGAGMFSISFRYDSNCPAQVTVMIGNRDRTTAEVIMCDEPLIKWGPLPLASGLNQDWNSKSLGLLAKECMFPGRSRATGLGNDIHDIIISLSPFGLSDDHDMMSGTSLISHFTQQHNQRSNNQRKSSKGVSSLAMTSPPPPTASAPVQSGGGASSSSLSISTLPSNVLNSLTDWSIMSSGNGSIAVMGLNGGGVTSNNNNSNSPNIDDVMKRAQTQTSTSNFPYPYSLNSSYKNDHNFTFSNNNNNSNSNMNRSFPFSKLSNRNQIIREVSYVRVTAAGQTAPGAKKKESFLDSISATLTGAEEWEPSPIAVKCVMQRVQLPGCVFLTQDIYGMDRGVRKSTSSSHNNNNTNSNGLASSSRDSAEGEGSVGEFDSDANECVVCLTEPRVVAVYPCRHMCLCASCAGSLPSQQNKCPLCRRTAVLLLQIELPSSSSNNSNNSKDQKSGDVVQ